MARNRFNRNPYIRPNKTPKLLPSIVAFVDILGYRHLIFESNTRLKAHTALKALHSALTCAREFVDPPLRRSSLAERDSFAVRAFSDNVVIGYPVQRHLNMQLFFVLRHLRAFQKVMTERGYFVRGGVAIGDLYVDDITVFGGGLIEAYEAESKLARDPRIVLASSARSLLGRRTQWAYQFAEKPHTAVLLNDTDGQLFINYLSDGFHMDGAVEDANALAQHKAAVEAKLRKHRHQPQFWSKYFWAAMYHNFVCAHAGSPALIRGRVLSVAPSVPRLQ